MFKKVGTAISLAGSIASLVAIIVSFISEQDIPTMPPGALEAIYAFLMSLGVLGAIAINWDWLQDRRPKKKLEALAPLAKEIYHGILDSEIEGLEAYKIPRRLELIDRLKALGVKTPVYSFRDGIRFKHWAPWLMVMLPLIRQGDLKAARKLDPAEFLE